MSEKKGAGREARLAQALRENLKRRKSQVKAKAKSGAPPAESLGTTPQAGLESEASLPPKSAPKGM